MAISKAEIKEAAATIWRELSTGSSDEEIMDIMGVADPETYAGMRKEALDEQVTSLRKRPPEHTYVEYMIWQLRGVKDLTDLLDKLKVAKNANSGSMVAAIKVRSDLYDKIIAKGQEFGVFKKAPETKLNIGGLFVGDLTNEKLRTQITGAVSDLDKLMKRYGDIDMADVDPGPLHHGPKLTADSSSENVIAVVKAPPSKDDLLNVVAKPLPDMKVKSTTKTGGKQSKAAPKRLSSKIRPPKTVAIKEEIAAMRWGD